RPAPCPSSSRPRTCGSRSRKAPTFPPSRAERAEPAAARRPPPASRPGPRPFNALPGHGIHLPVNTSAQSGSGPVPRDDGELLERARSGEAEARDALVRQYLPDVYRLTSRILGDSDLAQDATQDTFV